MPSKSSSRSQAKPDPEQPKVATDAGKQARILELRHAFSSLRDVKTPVADAQWTNIILAKDRQQFENYQYSGNQVLSLEIYNRILDLCPNESVDTINCVTSRVTTNLVLAVIANLDFSREDMMLGNNTQEIQYDKSEAGNVKAYAHALYYSEPDGEEKLERWVDDVFTEPINYFLREVKAEKAQKEE